MKRIGWVYIVAVALLVTVAVLSLSLGQTFVSPSDWLPILLGSDSESPQAIIIRELRLPRILSACLVGGTLACAGAAFQGLFRNVLAEPYIIGASSGAALGVAVSIVLGLQASYVGLGATAAMAMLGSVAVVGLVLAVGAAIRSSTTVTLLLAGIAISSLVNSLVSALMILNDPRAVAVLAWVMGSLAGSHWDSLTIAAIVGVPSMAVICALSRALDAFSLGDATAHSLGLNVSRFRTILVIAASLATAAAVSVAGIVGFIGLVAPHIARQLVGSRHWVMLPMSICVGAILMMLADSLSRIVIAPAELPVGIVTALIGSPFFLWLLLVGNARKG